MDKKKKKEKKVRNQMRFSFAEVLKSKPKSDKIKLRLFLKGLCCL